MNTGKGWETVSPNGIAFINLSIMSFTKPPEDDPTGENTQALGARWKVALIEKHNPDWRNLYEDILR